MAKANPFQLAAILLLALLLFSSSIIVVMFFQLSALNQKQEQALSALESLRADYSSLNDSFVRQGASLQEKVQALDAAGQEISALKLQLNEAGAVLSEKEKALAESKSSLEAQRQNAQQIASDLSGLETRINASMSWFRENAAFPANYSWKADIYLKRVLDDCVEGNELNLGCMSYLMENTAFAIHYRTDAQSTGKDDFLQSVKQTIDSGWGDCEDYSLIFKAALNSARAKSSGLQAVAWESGGEGKFYVYPKESKVTPDISYWYVPNAHKVNLGSLDSLHAYVVCYRLNAASGHCTVALSENAVSSASQISGLQGANVFEPQNGRYLGSIGLQFALCNPSFCSEVVGAVQIAISDSELYKFESGQWVGYSDYLGRVKDAEAMLLPFSRN